MYFGRETTISAIDGSKETTMQYPIIEGGKLRVIVDDFTTGKTKITNYDSLEDYIEKEKAQERQRRVVNTNDFGSIVLAIDRVNGQINNVRLFSSSLDFLLNRAPLIDFSPASGTITVPGPFVNAGSGSRFNLISGSNRFVFDRGANQVFFSANGGATVFSYVGESAAQTPVPGGFPAVPTTRSPSTASAAPSTAQPNSQSPTFQPNSAAPVPPPSDRPTADRTTTDAPQSLTPTRERTSSAPTIPVQNNTFAPNPGTNSPFSTSPPVGGLSNSPTALGITGAPAIGSSSTAQGDSGSTGIVVGLIAGLGLVAAGIGTYLYRRNKEGNQQAVQLNQNVVDMQMNPLHRDNQPNVARLDDQLPQGPNNGIVDYEEPVDNGQSKQNLYADPDELLPGPAPRGNASHYATAPSAHDSIETDPDDPYAEATTSQATEKPNQGSIVYDSLTNTSQAESSTDTSQQNPDPSATYSTVNKRLTAAQIQAAAANEAAKAKGGDGVEGLYAAPHVVQNTDPAKPPEEVNYAAIDTRTPEQRAADEAAAAADHYADLNLTAGGAAARRTDESVIYVDRDGINHDARRSPSPVPSTDEGDALVLAGRRNGHTPA